MTRRRIAIAVVVIAVAAAGAGLWFAGLDDKNETFEPVSEYRLDYVDVDVGIYGFDVGGLSTPSSLGLVGAAVFAVFAFWLWRRDRARRVD